MTGKGVLWPPQAWTHPCAHAWTGSLTDTQRCGHRVILSTHTLATRAWDYYLTQEERKAPMSKSESHIRYCLWNVTGQERLIMSHNQCCPCDFTLRKCLLSWVQSHWLKTFPIFQAENSIKVDEHRRACVLWHQAKFGSYNLHGRGFWKEKERWKIPCFD